MMPDFRELLGQKLILDFQETPEEAEMKIRKSTRWPQLSRWFDNMLRAGWQYWAWVFNDGDTNIMFRHLDEYEAAITQREARRYCLNEEIPNVYDVLADLTNEEELCEK